MKQGTGQVFRPRAVLDIALVVEGRLLDAYFELKGRVQRIHITERLLYGLCADQRERRKVSAIIGEIFHPLTAWLIPSSTPATLWRVSSSSIREVPMSLSEFSTASSPSLGASKASTGTMSGVAAGRLAT